MILSRIGRTGPIIWSMSGAATQLLRQLGLMFFLVEVGTKAGANMVETFQTYGINLFLIGGLITLVPMLLADRKSTRLNSSHVRISYAVFCLKKKKKIKCTIRQ